MVTNPAVVVLPWLKVAELRKLGNSLEGVAPELKSHVMISASVAFNILIANGIISSRNLDFISKIQSALSVPM